VLEDTPVDPNPHPAPEPRPRPRHRKWARGHAGAALTVLGLVVAALVYVLWAEHGDPTLDDRAELVEAWHFVEDASLPPGSRGLTDGVLAVPLDETTLDVYWEARPCATKPHITVTGTSAAMAVRIDPRDTDPCDDSLQTFKVRMSTAEPFAAAGASAELEP
jgi:hypothetical protein